MKITDLTEPELTSQISRENGIDTDGKANAQGPPDGDLASYRLGIEMGEALVKGGAKSLFDMGMALISDAADEAGADKGIVCVKTAAEAEYPEAMHVYAKFIAEGLIPGNDLGDALIWALRALKGGFPDNGLIGMIQQKMSGQNE